MLYKIGDIIPLKDLGKYGEMVFTSINGVKSVSLVHPNVTIYAFHITPGEDGIFICTPDAWKFHHSYEEYEVHSVMSI